MSGLKELITAEYDPSLLRASYAAYLRGEVDDDHMIEVLMPVIGAAMLQRYLDRSQYDQSDLVAAACEEILISLRICKAKQKTISSPLTYFFNVASNKMWRVARTLQTQVFTPDHGHQPLPSRHLQHADIENDLLIIQLSMMAHQYCLDHLRFKGQEKSICGYVLSKVMSGVSPSIAFIQNRYAVSKEKAEFFIQYSIVLYRLAKLEARQEALV